ncbi:hypothetical protein MAR_020426 [Mya arenaria]|uniref:Uncharacterized protein n=1 Tax=Mya arenaria TaxID=6604 RepID=A0ABY7E7W7_MYAAR|nr:hypothetical protein MAR_020426 [Mya arenaria]
MKILYQSDLSGVSAQNKLRISAYSAGIQWLKRHRWNYQKLIQTAGPTRDLHHKALFQQRVPFT